MCINDVLYFFPSLVVGIDVAMMFETTCSTKGSVSQVSGSEYKYQVTPGQKTWTRITESAICWNARLIARRIEAHVV